MTAIHFLGQQGKDDENEGLEMNPDVKESLLVVSLEHNPYLECQGVSVSMLIMG